MRVLKRLPDKTFWFNLKIRPLCQTLPKDLDMSKNTNRILRPSSKDFKIWCIIDRNWLVQKSPGLNPGWFFWDIKLFSMKNLKMLSYNSLSNILLETCSKEMGPLFFSSCLLFFSKTGTPLTFFPPEEDFDFLNMTEKLFLVVSK